MICCILLYEWFFIQAVLGSIIVVALKGMFMQFQDLPHLWKVDKIDLVSILSGFGDTHFKEKIGSVTELRLSCYLVLLSIDSCFYQLIAKPCNKTATVPWLGLCIIVRPSYLYDGHPFAGKTPFILKQASVCMLDLCVFADALVSNCNRQYSSLIAGTKIESDVFQCYFDAEYFQYILYIYTIYILYVYMIFYFLYIFGRFMIGHRWLMYSLLVA